MAGKGAFNPSKFLVSLLGFLGTVLILYVGFVLLREDAKLTPPYLQVFLPLFESDMFKAVFAIVWGVGAVALLFATMNGIVESFPLVLQQRIQPYVFIGPAVFLLYYYLAAPTVRSFWFSLFSGRGAPKIWDVITGSGSLDKFVGLDNYVRALTEPDMLIAFRNNVLWIVFGATLSVLFGLIIASLADRSSYENIAKAIIFLPMAISFVGAGVIWKFIYNGDANIGLLNAIWVGLFGGSEQAWTQTFSPPWNNLFLIVIVIWLQTGYAMVLFSAALKGIPDDLIEAARVDGASELQIYFRIMLPYIMGTIITVSTTVLIFTLKIFDVVKVMTGGQFGTQVIATEYYDQSFVARDYGYASAIAMLLFIAVIPVMIYNLQQFRRTQAF